MSNSGKRRGNALEIPPSRRNVISGFAREFPRFKPVVVGIYLIWAESSKEKFLSAEKIEVACDSIPKTKNDLDVNCRWDGFKDAHATIPSHFNGATAGNILAGGIIGIGIDAATGANDNYPTE
ncbi:MAG TPA: hypothetical protein VMJ73_03885 [Rhizomicrobium sp.]|nr:hypothetical protein [Rhizomicrobium sp.]